MVFKYIQKAFSSVRDAVHKTAASISGKLSSLWGGAFDEDKIEELEQILYEADFGIALSEEFSTAIREIWKTQGELPEEEALKHLRELARKKCQEVDAHTLNTPPTDTTRVIVVCGINGTGKTTACAKLAHHLSKEGNKLLLGACDTFRAAAIEQLEKWSENYNFSLVKGLAGGDSAAVAYDAVSKAVSNKYDTLILDTAGRLENKEGLMRELKKLVDNVRKHESSAPHEILLTIDATLGQNGLEQARVFQETLPFISGIILTKIDGSAKGGMALAIYNELKIPIKFISTGEGIEDLRPFNPEEFIISIF